LDESFDALFFVGQHAMAGTPNAPLCHTYSSRTVEYYKLNGQLIGEFGCRAAMAGSFGVPTIFLSGDDKACAEAKSLVPNILTVETKKGWGVELALHLSPQKAQRYIRVVAFNAIRRIRDIPPFTIDPPYEQEIRVLEGCSIEGYLKRGAEKVDERTVVRRSENICELFI
jgi:D-amino peptidase